jgi:hypothetical protein
MHTIGGRIPGLGIRFIAATYRVARPGLHFRVERYAVREADLLIQLYTRVVWIAFQTRRSAKEETTEAA